MKYIILQLTIVPAEGVDVEELKEMLLKGGTTMSSADAANNGVYQKGNFLDNDWIGKKIATVEKAKASVWPQDFVERVWPQDLGD